MLFERVKELAEQRGENLKTVAQKLGFSENAFYKWKKQSPKSETLELTADYFDVSTDYLLGRTDKKRYYDLTEEDEKDIQNELQRMIDSMNNKSGFAAADGSTMDELSEEDKELLLASLEQSLRIAKRVAKQKFTPKKYRD
ncbi:transcriptional regulator [Lentibacillus kapialis]|uniref:Transcriptional regulator n=1 Tax=Lentibacillus kapialis TaxID=340214 RepID=A0A917PPV3_9BACI|nr:helix-turn-helix transcriptional regulator [Lentibacillus kapialis]GGJ86328.1 transcriptional regulator [Lentibacillus kapialis]